MRNLFKKSPFKAFREGYSFKDFQILENFNSKSQLRIIDGNRTIAPGLRVHWGGRHTPGLQRVEIETSTGSVLLMSDDAYFYESIDSVRNKGKRPELVLPGHDPEIMERFYDKPAPQIAEISPEKSTPYEASEPLFQNLAVPKAVQRIRENKEDLHLFFVGDISLARAVTPEIKKTKDFQTAFPFVKSLFQLADVRFGNLECILSREPIRERKRHAYYLNADPGFSSVLKALSLEVLSVANNHTLDAGEKGLRDTVMNLNQMGIQAVGVPQGVGGRQEPVVLKKKGMTLAFLAYVDANTGDMKSFLLYPFLADPKVVSEDVQRVRPSNDLVIVSFHWGHEYDHLATERQKELAQAAKMAGADLVIGHHPHVLQEISWNPAKKQLVAYSLGNFIFDLFEPSRLRKVRRSMILYVRVDTRSKKIKDFSPISIYVNESFQPIPFFEAQSLDSLINPDVLRGTQAFFDLRENLRKAVVSLIEPEKTLVYSGWMSDIARFSFFNDQFTGEIVLHDRWQLGSDVTSSVGQGAEFSHGEFRKVIWFKVPEKAKLRIETQPLTLQKELSGFLGFPDWATMESEGRPIEYLVFAGNTLLYSGVLENNPGWRDFRIDTLKFRGKELPLRFEFNTSGTRRRYVGFNAWVK
jgi:poly-gamma-glutamate synthesis protein (capsule biosynthesis protein)